MFGVAGFDRTEFRFRREVTNLIYSRRVWNGLP
jgi:hypothetical protein